MIQYPAIVNPTPTIIRAISSKYVNQEFQLFISLPASYSESEQTYPVLYLLDGNGIFGLVKPIIELHQLMGNVPEIIIVGIGYPTQTYMETLALRERDLTPVKLTDEQKAKTSYPVEQTGGAGHFYSFIKDELIPLIDGKFRTNQDDRGLVGFSLGATFALYALFQQPSLFKRIVAISPSIDDIVPLENQYAEQHNSLPVKLYVGVENEADTLGAWAKGVESLVKRLSERNYADQKTNFRIFQGIDHGQAGPIGFAYAFKYIYVD